MQEEHISEKQLKSMLALLISLTETYDIDIESQHLFHKKTYVKPYIQDLYHSPLAYHKVVSDTSCPGRDTLRYMPFVQAFVANYPKYFPSMTNPVMVIYENLIESATI